MYYKSNKLMPKEENECSQEEKQFTIIKSLVTLIELKDPYTAGHSERVMNMSVGFAKYLKINEEKIKLLKYAAILHDIGKIGVPENILNKKGKLNKEEFEKIKMHPQIGYAAVVNIPFLTESVDVVLHHHEKVDGTGYPDGLVGNEISLFSKIVCLTDSFDAMNSNRSYKRALDLKIIIKQIKDNEGIQFDKELSEEFINYIRLININNYKRKDITMF